MDENPDFPLRGKVHCHACRQPLTASWATGRSKRYASYWCKTPGCRMRYKTVRKEVMENRDYAKKQLGTELKKVRMAVDEHLERAVSSHNPTLRKAYEQKVVELEKRKAVLEEQASKKTRVAPDFGTALDIVLAFIKNPHSVWKTDRFGDQRLVLNSFSPSRWSTTKKRALKPLNIRYFTASLSQNLMAHQPPSPVLWTRADSNRRPPHCERGALPAELRAQVP